MLLLPDGNFRVPGHTFVEVADKPVINEAIGKTASIVGTVGDRIVVKLNGSNHLIEVLPWYESLGFETEFQKAKALVGRQFWTTGSPVFIASRGDFKEYLTS